MSAESLAEYVRSNADDSAFLESCWAQASALIAKHVGSAEVPAEVLEGATLTVASEIYHRRQAPSGISQFATPGTQAPVRLARDPMTQAYPVLAPWLGWGLV
jgi:hypothetical protein